MFYIRSGSRIYAGLNDKIALRFFKFFKGVRPIAAPPPCLPEVALDCCVEDPITTATVGQLVLVICGESVVCSLLYLSGVGCVRFFRKFTPKIGDFTATWRNLHSTSRPPNFSWTGISPQHGMAAQAGPSNFGTVTGWVDQ